MSGISLTASMRSNLLSLQNIAGQQDIVQNRLATGLKVSSAIDNPSSYYTASSLNNRAADLTALLDAMSQGMQTIKAASEAIASGTKFLEQAKAVANQALETAQPVIARVSSEAELLAAIDSGQRGLIVLENDITLSENQTLSLKDGQSLAGNKYLGGIQKASLTFNITTEFEPAITLGNNSILAELDINFTSDCRQAESGIIFAENKSGITLENINIDMKITSSDGGYLGALYGGDMTVKGYLNINDLGKAYGNHDPAADNVQNCGIFNANLKMTSGAIVNINIKGQFSQALRRANLVMEGNSILNIKTEGHQGMGLSSSKITQKDQSVINVDTHGKAAAAVLNSFLTIESDKCCLNLNSEQTGVFFSSIPWGGLLECRFNLAAGVQISTPAGTYTAPKQISATLPNGFNDNSLAVFGLSEDTSKPADISHIFDDFEQYMQDTAAAEASENSISAGQYSEIIKQYDMLISDASYKGINLLEGQYLKINFNEDRSSKIDVPGVKADSESLGLKTKVWNTAEDVEKSISELEEAIGSLRSFASEFGNYYSIVTTRQDFTENLINVLEEGADKLTLADMNQESANMLSLQTAQQLAVNSLSLASQASQSILRLF